MNYLIVGLGNTGHEYQMTRHNIGFQVVEALAREREIPFEPARLGDVARLSYKGRKLTLVKPTTYMNRSGKAVRYWLQNLRIPLSNLLVIADDLHLPFGKLRLRPKGGHGGHNGLKNIIEEVGTSQYARLRFGIDAQFAQGEQSTYVLNPFTVEEQQKLPLLIQQAIEITLSFCWRWMVHTMNLHN